jgi:hypothetical protein
MAQRHIVQLIDDIDSSEATETIVFGIDGATYEIDLNATHAAALRDALATYVAHARRSASRSGDRGSSRRGSAPRVDREQIAAIREWARANGHTVGSKGRIPAHIVEAFNASV